MEPPNAGHILRRRKKRSSGGLVTGAPGSSLSGLSRSTIRVVELVRRSTGYGFTISGQKPCLLRSIIDGSPAAQAGLRRGHCLVGVNGKDVSHLAHDDVVRIIGNCMGLLRLHVAESYFSESSEDETFPSRESHPRPRYSHHRPRGSSKTSLMSTKRYSQSHPPLTAETEEPEKVYPVHEPRSFSFAPAERLPNRSSGQSSNSSSLSMYETAVQLSKPPVPLKNSESKQNRNPSSNGTNPRVETVRVFDSLDELYTLGMACDGRKVPSKTKSALETSNDRFNMRSSSGSSSRGGRKGTEFSKMNRRSFENGSIYQAVVGYVGSMELPEIKQDKRHETLSECIRIFRKQKKELRAIFSNLLDISL